MTASSKDLVKPDSFGGALTATPERFAQVVEQFREQDVNEFDITRIKIPAQAGTTWEIPTVRGEDHTKTLQGVILYSKFNRQYWPDPFSGDGTPPACSSPDGRTAQARPVIVEDGTETVPTIPADHDEQGRLVCDTCTFAEYGTAVGAKGESKRGQACKQTRLIFMLLPGRILPAVLTLPPTSLKSAKGYFLGLLDEDLDYTSLVTCVTLTKTAGKGVADYSVATFTAGDPLTPDQAARAAEYAVHARPQFMRVTAAADDMSADQG